MKYNEYNNNMILLGFSADLKFTLFRLKLSLCFNIPRFFQYEVVHNGTGLGERTIQPSRIGHSTLFGMIYLNALYTVLVLLLPLLLLIGLNSQLIRDIRASRQRASAVSGRHGMVAPSEENISVVMVIIIVVFIICQTPDRLCQILNLVLFDPQRCSVAKSRYQAVGNLLIIINSSSNFIIYYLFRKSFRSILKQRICAMPGIRAHDEISNTTARPLNSGVCMSESNLLRYYMNGCENVRSASNPLNVRAASNPLLETTQFSQ